MQALRRILGLRPVEEDTTTQTQNLQTTQQDVPVTAPLGTTTPKPVSADGSEDDMLIAFDNPANRAAAEADGQTRKLPPLETVMPNASSGSRMIIGQRSDIGQVRENNQDAMFNFNSSVSSVDNKPDFGLFIVADGMGGHEDGEKASAMTVRVVASEVVHDIFSPMLYTDPGGDYDMPTVAEVLRKSFQKANDIVSVEVPDGGTTCTAAAIMGNLAYIAHVGDSRAYLINDDVIEQITRDHSLVARLKELGHEVDEKHQQNVLYRAIGQSDNLDVDAITRQVPPGGYLLLCSDGLWNLISEDEIRDAVLNYGNDTQAACESLVEMANQRGGSDNITVVAVRIPNKGS